MLSCVRAMSLTGGFSFLKGKRRKVLLRGQTPYLQRSLSVLLLVVLAIGVLCMYICWHWGMAYICVPAMIGLLALGGAKSAVGEACLSKRKILPSATWRVSAVTPLSSHNNHECISLIIHNFIFFFKT